MGQVTNMCKIIGDDGDNALSFQNFLENKKVNSFIEWGK